MPFWVGVLLLPLVIPISLVARLVAHLLGRKGTEDRNADEVAGFLRDFIEGTGGAWDWDEFESVPITDPELEAIRREAAMAGPGPRWDDANFDKLRALLARAEAIALADRASDARHAN